MAVKPKIHTKEDIDKLSKCYIDNNMSTVDIENESKKIFGQYISRGTIYNSLVKYKINIRDKSKSVKIATSTLDIDSEIETEDIVEWIDGLMLGDGGISFKKNSNFSGARYFIGTSSRQWASHAMSGLSLYLPSAPKTYNKIDKKHPNPIWQSQTKTHPDIIKQAKRWYSGKNESKKIPKDIKITPTSVLLWYLGDGSFTYQYNLNAGKIRLATCSFSKRNIENILFPKLNSFNIKCNYDTKKGDIIIFGKNIKNFFNFIGWESPFSNYDYKFSIPEWLKLYRLSEITSNNKQKWKVQYWCKTGKINYSKSPNGRFLLFSEAQKNKVVNKLNNL